MKILLTSDIHLTDSPQDAYRWDLFPWIEQQISKHGIKVLIIGGDHTHKKDNHPASLTNRIVENLVKLSKQLEGVYCIKGNHDYIDASTPYLGWINHIPKIRFFIDPEYITLDHKIFLFLPNSSTPLEDWAKIPTTVLTTADYIICHQTFEGSNAENGQQLSGISQSILRDLKARVFCGDIHLSQTLGKITYIGTPYPISFADKGPFRCILLDSESELTTDLFLSTINRHTITISNPDELLDVHFNPGDQVKVRLALDSITNWDEYKTLVTQFCEDRNLILHRIEFAKKDSALSLEAQKVKLRSLTPSELFDKYCEALKIVPEIKIYGETILKREDHA